MNADFVLVDNMIRRRPRTFYARGQTPLTSARERQSDDGLSHESMSVLNTPP